MSFKLFHIASVLWNLQCRGRIFANLLDVNRNLCRISFNPKFLQVFNSIQKRYLISSVLPHIFFIKKSVLQYLFLQLSKHTWNWVGTINFGNLLIYYARGWETYKNMGHGPCDNIFLYLCLIFVPLWKVPFFVTHGVIQKLHND